MELDLRKPDTMDLPRGARIAWLIPPIPDPDRLDLRRIIESIDPERVVYVSSTGVYGNLSEVDEKTPAAPADERGRLRMDEEEWISGHEWSTLILRAAAIYGPGRGVQQAVKEGRAPRGAGSAVVSRIHVDDLAALIDAGLGSTLEGAWPVADEEPCASDEIIHWCEEFLGMTAAKQQSDGVAPGGRDVNGRRICELLGVHLTHPSWRTGVCASLQE
jgi:nucleoside-diphosphate-sugar epimerase